MFDALAAGVFIDEGFSERIVMRVAHRDLMDLISRLPDIYAPASLQTVTRKLLLVVSMLVPCFAASCDEWDVDRSGHVLGYRVTLVPTFPEAEELLHRLPMFIHNHPLFPFLQERVTHPLKISDVSSQREFLRGEVYNEVYRLGQVHHQMICFPPGQESPHLCITVNRQGPDFSERDRAMLSLLWPHFRQAHSNAAALSAATAPAKAPRIGSVQRAWEVVELDPKGHPRAFSNRANEWLKTYFDDAFPRRPWPDRLGRWIRQQRWPTKPNEKALSHRHPFIVERGGRMLRLNFLPGRGGAGILLLSESRTTPCSREAFRSLPLTSREREVFRWICEGKTNPEIALILGISPRTVQKHAEHIFVRLGVENRLQAQRLGWELQGGRD